MYGCIVHGIGSFTWIVSKDEPCSSTYLEFWWNKVRRVGFKEENHVAGMILEDGIWVSSEVVK